MPQRILLTQDNRDLLNDIRQRLGWKQNVLAKKAGVTESWLSPVLKSVSDKKESGKVASNHLSRVARALAEGINASDKYKDEEKESEISKLDPFDSTLKDDPTLFKRFRSARMLPGQPLTEYADGYVPRTEADTLNETLRGMPVSILVTGPPQTGKTTLLAQFIKRASAAGIQIAEFDPLVTGETRTLHGRPPAEQVAAFARALYTLLRGEWGLPEEATDNLVTLHAWLQRSLRLTAGMPRLIVLKGLASFDHEALEEILNFLRAIHNRRATNGAMIFLAVEFTFVPQQNFQRCMLQIGSIIAWQPRIDLGWFKGREVDELTKSLEEATSPIKESIYPIFQGQPYLTHSMVIDEEFRAAVMKWWTDRADANVKSLRAQPIYKTYVKVLTRTIQNVHNEGPIKNVLGALISIRQSKVIQDSDAEDFLQAVKLIDHSKPLTEFFGLIIEDIIESLKGDL